MSARIIIPSIQAGDAAGTNFYPDELEPVYSGSATYDFGDYVRATKTEDTPRYVDGVLTIFRTSETFRWKFVGLDGTSGNHVGPLVSAQTDWAFDGPLRHQRPFYVPDSLESARPILISAERADAFTALRAGSPTTTGLGIFGAYGTEIVIDVYSGFAAYDAGGSGDVYHLSYPIPTDGVGDSYYSVYNANGIKPGLIANFALNEYAARAAQWGDLTITDVRWPNGNYIKVTVNNAGGVARLGAVVPGYAENIGATLVGASWSPENFGVQTFDGVTAKLVRRTPGAFVDVDVKLTAPAAQVRKLFERITNIPAAFQFSADHPEYDVYGVIEGNSPMVTNRSRTHTFTTIRVRAV